MVDVLDGELLTGEDRPLTGRIWVHASSVETETGIDESTSSSSATGPGPSCTCSSATSHCWCSPTARGPDEQVLALAREKRTAVVVSPLDTYVAARMITLAAPCRELMENDQIVATTDELISDVSEQIKDSHHGAAIVCRRPASVRSDC